MGETTFEHEIEIDQLVVLYDSYTGNIQDAIVSNVCCVKSHEDCFEVNYTLCTIGPDGSANTDEPIYDKLYGSSVFKTQEEAMSYHKKNRDNILFKENKK